MRAAVTVWAPSAALALLAVLETYPLAGAAPGRATVTTTLLVLAAGAMAVRVARPVAAAVVASACVSGAVLLQPDLAAQPPLTAFLVMLVGFFAMGHHARAEDLPLGLAAAGLPLVTADLAALVAGRPAVDMLPTLLFWSTAFALGRLLRRRVHEADEERRRADHAERLAAEAASAERARIAREIHDVVAHSLSVVVLHAGVERRLMTDRSSTSYQALDTIERTGRTALTELRHLLGLLHRPDTATELEPLPSLRDVEQLGDTLRQSGHDVSVQVTGGGAELPQGVGLSAYRIVQEAITNAIKHAPGASVHVRVSHGHDAVTVEVTNAAPPAQHPGSDHPPVALLGAGRGLVGMRERVRVYGGRLSAAPLPCGGFKVHAELPREAG